MIKESQLQKEYFKPKEVSLMFNVHVRTIQHYCNTGKLQAKLTGGGRRNITKESLVKLLKESNMYYDDSNVRKDVIYARVSTNKQKQRGDLDRQVEKISLFVVDKNPTNLEIITDVASGLNDKRKGLLKLIQEVQENKVNRVFINYKDRLTRFGFNYLKAICDYHQTEIVVVSEETQDKSVSEELAEDIISIIHSFSGKLYGMRKSVKEEIDKELESEVG